MALLGTVPSESAHNWTTEYAAAIREVSPILLDVNKSAMPTLRILLQHAQPYELGPDGKIRHNFKHKMYSPHVMRLNQTFNYEDLDMISQMEWYTKQVWCGAGINDFQQKRYERANRSVVDIAYEKLQAVKDGLTWYFNYSLFSNWSETITNNQIDIETALSSAAVPPDVKLKDISTHSDMIYSIPMIIRKHVTGHTIGNVSSANSFWKPTVTDHGTATRNTTAGAVQADVVTNDSAATATLDPSDLREHLGAMQVGANYQLYAACPRSLYAILSEYILAERQRTPQDDAMDADLGIRGSITWQEYNTTFYVEPMMDYLWNNTIFFYDPECMFLEYDPAFYPKVVPWEKIPGTNQEGTVVYYDLNLVCVDRRGVGAIHGASAT